MADDHSALRGHRSNAGAGEERDRLLTSGVRIFNRLDREHPEDHSPLPGNSLSTSTMG